jgi:hypothetical protein
VPDIAATMEGAPNMMAIPAATPIIKPHETFPEKKPIPVAIMAKAANVFPALPVTILKALQIDFEKVLLEVLLRARSPLFSDV